MTARLLVAAAVTVAAFAAVSLPTSNAMAQSVRGCEDYAYRMAYRDRDGRDVLRGTIGGAAAGAIIGGIIGGGDAKDFGRGALAGGVAGTALGALNDGNGGTINRRAYNRAYRDCMRGNRVLYRDRNTSRDDVEYCMSRYRSYNPDTGMYLTYSGRYRPCP